MLEAISKASVASFPACDAIASSPPGCLSSHFSGMLNTKWLWMIHMSPGFVCLAICSGAGAGDTKQQVGGPTTTIAITRNHYEQLFTRHLGEVLRREQPNVTSIGSSDGYSAQNDNARTMLQRQHDQKKDKAGHTSSSE